MSHFFERDSVFHFYRKTLQHVFYVQPSDEEQRYERSRSIFQRISLRRNDNVPRRDSVLHSNESRKRIFPGMVQFRGIMKICINMAS
jgi:hypothetical protein